MSVILIAMAIAILFILLNEAKCDKKTEEEKKLKRPGAMDADDIMLAEIINYERNRRHRSIMAKLEAEKRRQ